MKKPRRQGDMILIPVDSGTHGTFIDDLVLARGEATSHLHKVVDGEAKLSRISGDELLLEILSDQVILRHGTDNQICRQKTEFDFDYVTEDCHLPQVLSKGFVKILIQKDYQPKGWKNISD